MKKHITKLLTLLFVLCTAITVSAKDIASGEFKNGGSWRISDQGMLSVDASTIPDFKKAAGGGDFALLTSFGYNRHRYIKSAGSTAPWFSFKSYITQVALSENVSRIGSYAFAGLGNVKAVYIKSGSGNIQIGEHAFEGCVNLKTMDFSRVKTIGANAFYYCLNLRGEFNCPVLTNIGKDAFERCYGIWDAGVRFYLSGDVVVAGLDEITESNHSGVGLYSVDFTERYQVVKAGSWVKIIIPADKQASYVSTYGEEPFKGCKFMAGGKIGTGMWYYTTNGNCLYITSSSIPDFASASEQPWYLLRNEIKAVDVQYTYNPDYNYSIGSYAFAGLTKLSQFWSLNDLKNAREIEIHDYAFAGCTNLYKMEFDHVYTIGKNAFEDTKFSTLNLVKANTIDNNAFKNVPINQISFSSGLTSIGQNAFQGSFKSGGNIYVYSSVPTTSSSAFSGASSTTKLHVKIELASGYQTTSPWSSFQMDVNATFPVSGTWGIGYGTWMIDTEGTLVVKGGGSTGFDTRLPDYANESDQPWYLYRNYIKRVNIEEGLVGIGKNAFASPNEGESQIAEVVVPASVETIGENAFKNNDQIEEVQAEGVKNIGSQAFENCSALEKVKFGKDVKSLGTKVFNNCGIVDVMAVKSATPPAVTAQTFQGMGVVSSNAPAKVKAKYAARKAKAATGQKSVSLEVPDEHVSKYLAAQYWNLFSFEYIGEHGGIVESDQAYDGLYVLYSDGTMIISASAPTDPQNINVGFTISSNAKSKVKRVEIQGLLTKLGHQFNDCPNLEEVVLSGGINSLNGTFNNCPKLKTINLENVQYLKSHQQGNKVIPCFGNCAALQEVNIPGVLEIGDNCFKGCTGLTTVALGGEAEVGMEAFSGCTALKRIALGNAKLNGALQAFEGCTALEEMTYSGTRMPAEIFKGCTALHKINLGGSLKDILSEAFANTAIDSIYVQCPTPPEAAANAFSGITLSSIKVIVPDAFDGPYWSAPVWEDMFFYDDEDYAELDFPIHFAIGNNGFGTVDESGNLTINAMGALVDNFRDYVEPYAPYIIGAIRIGNEVSSLPAGTPYRLPFGWVKEDGPSAIVLGSGLLELGDYALYNNVWDCDLIVDCYALNPPVMKGANVFNWSKIQNGSQCVATLNVVNDAAVEAAYRADTYWKKFSISSWLTPADAPAECTVTFVDWDGTILQQTTTRPGMMVTPPADPVREGYTFKGWDSQDYTWVVSDLTITATYYDETYTVRFYDWDGTLLSEQQVHYGQAAEAPADPAREGYTFLGWSEDFSDVKIDKYIVAMYHNDHEGIEDIQPDQVPNIKVMIDGVIYILRDGKIYNILGTEVR